MPALLGGTGIIGKDIFVKMKAQKSASIQTASGTVVTFPQSAERAFSGLNVYGHSTQDGTPSPENPVPIVSAGSVMTTGAQLINQSYLENYDSWKTDLASGGTYPTGITNKGFLISVEPNKQYTISFDGSEEFPDYFYLCKASDDNASLIAYLTTNILEHSEYTFSITDNEIAYLRLGNTGNESDFISAIQKIHKLMLNEGSTALPWEPYTGGVPGVNPYAGEINVTVSDGGAQSQTLTLSTPGGLPGIPVDSGGNYTDADGQQWVCDEIDLKRGKYVQRVGEVKLSGTESYTLSENNGRYYYSIESESFTNFPLTTMSDWSTKGLCTHFQKI